MFVPMYVLTLCVCGAKSTTVTQYNLLLLLHSPSCTVAVMPHAVMAMKVICFLGRVQN